MTFTQSFLMSYAVIGAALGIYLSIAGQTRFDWGLAKMALTMILMITGWPVILLAAYYYNK